MLFDILILLTTMSQMEVMAYGRMPLEIASPTSPSAMYGSEVSHYIGISSLLSFALLIAIATDLQLAMTSCVTARPRVGVTFELAEYSTQDEQPWTRGEHRLLLSSWGAPSLEVEKETYSGVFCDGGSRPE